MNVQGLCRGGGGQGKCTAPRAASTKGSTQPPVLLSQRSMPQRSPSSRQTVSPDDSQRILSSRARARARVDTGPATAGRGPWAQAECHGARLAGADAVCWRSPELWGTLNTCVLPGVAPMPPTTVVAPARSPAARSLLQWTAYAVPEDHGLPTREDTWLPAAQAIGCQEVCVQEEHHSCAAAMAVAAAGAGGSRAAGGLPALCSAPIAPPRNSASAEHPGPGQQGGRGLREGE